MLPSVQDNQRKPKGKSMKQVYLTAPLAIAYWFIPFGVTLEGDSFAGFLLFGGMLTLGALSDLREVKV